MAKNLEPTEIWSGLTGDGDQSLRLMWDEENGDFSLYSLSYERSVLCGSVWLPREAMALLMDAVARQIGASPMGSDLARFDAIRDEDIEGLSNDQLAEFVKHAQPFSGPPPTGQTQGG